MHLPSGEREALSSNLYNAREPVMAPENLGLSPWAKWSTFASVLALLPGILLIIFVRKYLATGFSMGRVM